jgi:hypothetical protein
VQEQPRDGTTSGGSAAQPLNNLEPAHRRRRPGDVHATTTNTPTRVLTSTPVPMLTPQHSSGGPRRTSPPQPCYCVAARR